MRRLLIFGLLVGFAGTLAGAHFLPWVNYDRVSSQTSVVANGGRAERFVVRLPVDRIQAVDSADSELRGSESSASIAIPESVGPMRLEHFKVRDSIGNVIGIAARHWLQTPDGPAATWALSIPSRGSLVMTGGGEAREVLETALASRGYRAGAAWSGELVVRMVEEGTATRSVMGSQEFSRLDVQFTETWTVTGVGEDGELRGTIALDTISRRGG